MKPIKAYKSLRGKTFLMVSSETRGRISVSFTHGDFWFIDDRGIHSFNNLKAAIKFAKIA
jgi:hypothetical protein